MQIHLRGIQRKCPHCGLEFLTLSTLEASQWSHPDNCESRSTTISSKSGKKSRKICKQSCVDCGAFHADIWKHKRNCIALNNDIKGPSILYDLMHLYFLSVMLPKCKNKYYNKVVLKGKILN